MMKSLIFTKKTRDIQILLSSSDTNFSWAAATTRDSGYVVDGVIRSDYALQQFFLESFSRSSGVERGEREGSGYSVSGIWDHCKGPKQTVCFDKK